MNNSLENRHILVCVSASIAAYKSLYIIRTLRALGAFVSVAVTPSTSRFVGSESFSALASEPVYDDLWDNRGAISHTTLGKSADLVVVVPATASIISKMANGIADDIVSATLLCTPLFTPIIVAPAMHEEMYDNKATQENISKLISRGVTFVGPETGELAGGDVGKGRLSDPDDIIASVVSTLKDIPESLEHAPIHNKTNRKIDKPVFLITAGGTREQIDPVRVITNRSSGKMGHALARAANVSGYHVVLITTSDLDCDDEIERVDVSTAQQMHDTVMKYLDQSDVVIMTAAVADFTPKEMSDTKIKRENGVNPIELVPTVDIVAEIIANRDPHTYVVCFAAETDNIFENANKKLEAKKVDMLVVNDITRADSGFGSDTNKVWILTSGDQNLEFEVMDKTSLAFEIVDSIDIQRNNKD